MRNHQNLFTYVQKASKYVHFQTTAHSLDLAYCLLLPFALIVRSNFQKNMRDQLKNAKFAGVNFMWTKD